MAGQGKSPGPASTATLSLAEYSAQGSKYLVVMVDMFSRYVLLAPIKEKTAKNVAHAIVSKLICEFSAPRVLLSDDGAEFRNRLLQEICNQFGINHTFTVAYHK